MHIFYETYLWWFNMFAQIDYTISFHYALPPCDFIFCCVQQSIKLCKDNVENWHKSNKKC